MDEQVQDNSPKRMADDAEIKEVLKAIGDGELLASEASQGFSFSEIVGLIKVGLDLPPVVRDISVMWPEFKALDDAARADLVSYVQANCAFPANANVNDWVQKALEGVIWLSSTFQMLEKL